MLMLEQWHPKSPKGWTAFTYCWLKQHGPFKDTEEVLASLPGHIDRSLAKDNFEKVKDRYPISERTKPVSRVQDFNGIPQTTWFTNSESLKETFCDAHGYQNWSDAAEEGYLVKTQHVLASDVSALTSQKDIDYCEA
ncbi:MAG: hypothetical protein C9356_12280 [Oleiphilus sp.]|nr:MAG: hypothetical protein C9356_12280 [Oleiphilus sp.]